MEVFGSTEISGMGHPNMNVSMAHEFDRSENQTQCHLTGVSAVTILL